MKRKECQEQLDLIKNVHENHLQWGYKILNHRNCNEKDIKVTYANEWHGKYGFQPAIYITTPGYDMPIAVMTPTGAYRYIIAGMFKYADVSIACLGHY